VVVHKKRTYVCTGGDTSLEPGSNSVGYLRFLVSHSEVIHTGLVVGQVENPRIEG